MALYTGRLLMRGGNEADFDPDKMMPREWAVSTDKKIVRICIAPGICIRIATYEAFEKDMAKIENILKECQSIQEAVIRINTEVNKNADAVAEYTAQAKQFRDEAKQFRDEAFATTPDGYEEIVETVVKNTVKIDTVIEKADLGIKETVSGEEIHTADSSNAKIREFALFGKAKQNTTSGKNLIPYPYTNTTHEENGIAWTDLGDGRVMANGTAEKDEGFILKGFVLPAGNYILSDDCNVDRSKINIQLNDSANGLWIGIKIGENKESFTISNETNFNYNRLLIKAGTVVNNVVFKPMIRLASIEDDTWEPYTGGIPSPNPDYPQDIEVAGESYNLLENTATSKTVNGVEFVVNEDGSVTANGTATNGHGRIFFVEKMPLPKGKYTLSGCPSGGSNTTYYLRAILYDSNDSQIYYCTDAGYTMPFEITEEGVVATVFFNFDEGTIANNHTCYPMIRKASVKNDRYMPYGKGSVEVTSKGKNLIPYPYNGNISTNSGITWTNENGIITANGTATAEATYYMSNNFNLPKGSYILSGCPSGGSASSYRMQLANSSCTTIFSDIGNGVSVVLEENKVFSQFRILIPKGVTANNLVFKPMLRLASDTDDTYELYKETKATIPTPNGLAGKSVSSGGSYTDSNGQQWICDEILKYADGSGEFVQRVISEVFDGITNKVNAVNISTEYGVSFSSSAKNNTLMNKLVVKSGNSYDLLCSHFVTKFALYNPSTTKDYGCGIYRTSANIWFSIDKNTASKIGINVDTATVEQFNLWLQENPITVYGILAEPIRTQLTVEQIAEIEKVCTFYPVTNISNDADCGMKVTYLADSKNYIDNKLALQAKAKEEEMMAMFLLLPEETQAAMIENDTNNLLLESEE